MRGVPLIEARGLTKVFRRPVKGDGLAGSLKHLFTRRFTDHVAVRDVDLSVEAGEALAYVGPNGAGKSTTVKLLSGILVPTSGTVRVGGVVPHRERVANARQIGLLFGQRTQLWWDLPVRESLALLRDIYRLSPARYAESLERLDEVLGLGELLPIVARKLSLGQRMRADLGAALLHQPRIVYLDEPTIGLDIAVKDRVRAFLRQLVADGTTLLLTTHDLGDIEDVCRRIVIIDDGRIIFDGGIDAMKDTYARDRRLHVQLTAPVTPARVADLMVGGGIEATVTTGATAVTGDDVADGRGEATRFTIEFDRFAVTAAKVIEALQPAGEVADFHLDEPAIEDVIRRVYSGDLRLAPEPA
jgi:ABC-2 type transport system ATP-binding protein